MHLIYVVQVVIHGRQRKVINHIYKPLESLLKVMFVQP